MTKPITKETSVLTVGQVAKVCKISPRTVMKWFDSGRLKGYRLPGSQDRRIPRKYLIAFLQEYGLPLGDLEETQHPDIHSDGCVETILRWRPGGAQGAKRPDEDWLFVAIWTADEEWDYDVDCLSGMLKNWDWEDVDWYIPLADFDLPVPE